jgi:hypothetical protein
MHEIRAYQGRGASGERCASREESESDAAGGGAAERDGVWQHLAAGAVETPFAGEPMGGYGRGRGIDALRHYQLLKTVTIAV